MNEKKLTVKISYAPASGNFFVDLWEGDKYLVSVKLTEQQAANISRDTGIRILEQ